MSNTLLNSKHFMYDALILSKFGSLCGKQSRESY